MYRILPLFVTFIVALAVTAGAEKIDVSEKDLYSMATHIITGKVMAIYERTEKKDGWKYTYYVAEILVDKCEKGKSVIKGDLIYSRYWSRSWIGSGQIPLSTNGHRGRPKEGDNLRVYLAQKAYDGFTYDNNDGGFNVIGANGFKSLK